MASGEGNGRRLAVEHRIDSPATGVALSDALPEHSLIWMQIPNTELDTRCFASQSRSATLSKGREGFRDRE